MKSPLRNETVKVMFVPRTFMGIKDKSHPCFGGMADNATYTFYGATTRGEQVLNDDEREFFEKHFGLEEGALGVNRVKDNFWTGHTTNFNSVTIPKTGLVLDLSKVEDYLKYKILMSNKNVVANGLTVRQAQNSGYTYQFTMISEKAIEKEETENANVAYEAFNKIRDLYNSTNTLNYILSKITGQTYSLDTKIDALRAGIMKEVQENPRRVLDIANKKNIDKYVNLFIAEKYGILQSRDGIYYVAATGKPLTSKKDVGEGATAESLDKPDNQTIYLEIVNAIKEKEK